MNKFTQQLVELSNYDKEIDVFVPKIENIEVKLKLKEDKIIALAQENTLLEDEIEDLKAQIRQTNVQISEFSKKIEDSKTKSSIVKTEKEIKALAIENELAKEQIKAANEEMERLERILLSKEDFKKELKEKEKFLLEEFEEAKLKSQEELNKIDEQRSKISLRKDELSKQMNQKVLAFYQKIRKWAGNTAVVPVRKQACYGCYLKLNDKYYSLLLTSDDIMNCPHCGRIIYKED